MVVKNAHSCTHSRNAEVESQNVPGNLNIFSAAQRDPGLGTSGLLTVTICDSSFHFQ